MSSADIADVHVKDPSHLEDWLQFNFGFLDLYEAWYASFALHEETHEKNYLSWRCRTPYAADPAWGVGRETGIGVQLDKSIPGVYWGNYFGPFYVDWFGKNTLDSLPCVEKRWLSTGGLFFTTAMNPRDWSAPEALECQEAVKTHLGREAFFDIHEVRSWVRALEPIPESLKPEDLQPPRRVPEFPFKVEHHNPRPVEVEKEEVMKLMSETGLRPLGEEEGELKFVDGKGGRVTVRVGAGGRIAYQPHR